MKKGIVIGLFLISSWQSSWVEAKPQWITPDFFVETLSKPFVSPLDQDTQNCREKISKAVCLVDPTENPDASVRRPCLEGGDAYAIHFKMLYDFFPPVLRTMFCSVDVIYIEKQFQGTAYAGVLRDPNGKIRGAQMGIRKSVLDDRLTLTKWASWKEQLSFGGISDSYTLTPGLPLIRTASWPGANDFLFFVISHEFGHIFDFTNNVSKGGWGDLSWLTEETPKPENEFPHRKDLCFYWCENHPLSKEAASEVYRALYHDTNFISIYATSNPWEDFADSLAYFVMGQHLQTSYIVDTQQHQAYNIMQKLRSEKFRSKYRYIDDFLNRKDVAYP